VVTQRNNAPERDRAADSGVDSRALPRYAAGSIAVPFVIQNNNEIIARDTLWQEHSHPTHELLWNDRGASSASVGARTWTITPTTGLWIPAGLPHSGWTPAGTWFRSAQFSVDAAPSIASGPVSVDISALLKLLLDRLGSDGLDVASRATTEALILDVLAPASREIVLVVPESALLSPVVAAVLDDPADATTLSVWATRLGVSERTVTRAFTAETGLGFSRWVAAARAQHAIALLAAGDEIDDVAARVGFGSASAFGTAFRRVTGVSPGRFRAL